MKNKVIKNRKKPVDTAATTAESKNKRIWLLNKFIWNKILGQYRF